MGTRECKLLPICLIVNIPKLHAFILVKDMAFWFWSVASMLMIGGFRPVASRMLIFRWNHPGWLKGTSAGQSIHLSQEGKLIRLWDIILLPTVRLPVRSRPVLRWNAHFHIATSSGTWFLPSSALGSDIVITKGNLETVTICLLLISHCLIRADTTRSTLVSIIWWVLSVFFLVCYLSQTFFYWYS